MSEFEIFFRLEGGEYGDGVVLNKYGDRYSLVAARESQKGGTVWKEWAFPQDKEKKPRAKAIPLGVRLGDRNQAIGILRAALAALDKEHSIPSKPNPDPIPGKPDDDPDIPF
jgi:hypothetical protein